MNNELKLLFNRLCEAINLPNGFEIKDGKGKKYLKLDHNSIYGGYRINIVHESTGESFYDISERLSSREMTIYIRGLLKGLEN